METLTKQLTGCHTTTLMLVYKIVLHECDAERFGEDYAQPENNCFLNYNILYLNIRVGVADLMDVNKCNFIIKGRKT